MNSTTCFGYDFDTLPGNNTACMHYLEAPVSKGANDSSATCYQKILAPEYEEPGSEEDEETSADEDEDATIPEAVNNATIPEAVKVAVAIPLTQSFELPEGYSKEDYVGDLNESKEFKDTMRDGIKEQMDDAMAAKGITLTADMIKDLTIKLASRRARRNLAATEIEMEVDFTIVIPGEKVAEAREQQGTETGGDLLSFDAFAEEIAESVAEAGTDDGFSESLQESYKEAVKAAAEAETDEDSPFAQAAAKAQVAVVTVKAPTVKATVDVPVEDEESSTEESSTEKKEDDDDNTPIIVGAVVGALVVVLILVYVVMSKKKSGSGGNDDANVQVTVVPAKTE